MTPSEKAIELVQKYRPLINDWNCYWDTQRHDDEMMVDMKKCALISVDEIINLDVFENQHNAEQGKTFWLAVKEEINKL